MTPLAILGLGALVPAAGAVIAAIAKKGRIENLYVLWLDSAGGVVKSGPFSMEKALAFQNVLKKKGVASIGLAAKIDGSLDRTNPVSVVRPRLGNAANDFDSNEEQLDITSATTRNPEPGWVRRMNDGPYPDTRLPREDSLPVPPLFRQTSSSHEWRTSVVPGETPAQESSEAGY